MGKLFNKINKGFSRLFRVLLFVLSAFLIIYFFPKSGKFKYNFENGRPWQSENLYAPFDFAIKKSADEINREEEEVRLNTPLFFEIDSSANSKSSKKIFERFDGFGFDTLFINYKKKELEEIKFNSIKILNDVYLKGLLDENFDFNNEQKISILQQNKLTKSTVFNELIKPEDLPLFINNKILEYGLENYKAEIISIVFDHVTPNIRFNETLSITALKDSENKISPNRGFIEKETLIISKGEIVEGEKLIVLESLKKEYEVSDSSFSDLYLREIVWFSFRCFLIGIV